MTKQRETIKRSLIAHTHTTFLSGPAGAGKTTLAVQHLRALLEAGVAGDSLLVIAPQRSLLRPYQDELQRAELPPSSLVETLTLGGLARRMVSLCWPAVAETGGFAHPQAPPVFLTLETAQYHMQRLVAPLVAEAGYFDGVHIQPNRLYSQILDTLNKAAVVGFSHLEIGQRLKDAWSGPASRAAVFSQVQDCASRFRQFCLQNNALDFSLQVELLTRHLLTLGWFRGYLFGGYRHLIADNVEEDTPVTHDLLRDWLGECDSALIVYDAGAGFRGFLGADPEGGWGLQSACQEHVTLDKSHVSSPELEALAAALTASLSRHVGALTPALSRRSQSERGERVADIRAALGYGSGRFHPQALDWVAAEIVRLIDEENVPAGEIVVLAPYLSDALRFALSNRLAQAGVAVRSLRPSRALNEEPAARCLLTLAALAYPDWQMDPPQPDIAHALGAAIDGLDPLRAHLLAQRSYQRRAARPGDGSAKAAPAPVIMSQIIITAGSFDALAAGIQDRIGYEIGERYETLRAWLEEQRQQAPLPLDHFLSRLFGEVLSQPGFAFHRDLDSGRVAAGLIASARKFRQALAPHSPGEADPQSFSAVGRAYVEAVNSGIIAAEYGPRPSEQDSDAILLAPAYTFLLSNQPVEVQFWINAGSLGWWERLLQPLTHPYVLTRTWPAGRPWTDEDEQAARVARLHSLIEGLIRRCRRRVYLAFSTLNERGFEERGPLLMAAQQVLRQLAEEEQIANADLWSEQIANP
ncbi:MAG: DEAD/DEAH box helicase family protein [Thermoflexales bacterium]|nr:DEAD/DEAH box helicase family protein [Thermoflexales bacterium]